MPKPEVPFRRGENPLEPVDYSDAALVDAVLAHYRDQLWSWSGARSSLGRLGISEDVARRYGMGLSNRTLGVRLPRGGLPAGKALRAQLMKIGLMRPTGHEQFVGNIVVPITDAGGKILGVYGRREDRRIDWGPVWAKGMPGGLFNAAALGHEVVVVPSPFDALAAISAGFTSVVAPGRPGGLVRPDMRLIERKAAAVTVVGDDIDGLTGRLTRHGLEVAAVRTGRLTLYSLLASTPDAGAALRDLIDSATEIRASGSAADGEADTDEDADAELGVSGDASELHIAMGARRWRVRGADRVKGPDSLRVAISVTQISTERFHLDTFDLYQAKSRDVFVDAAAVELRADRDIIRRELAEVLFATEAAVAARDAVPKLPEMSPLERAEALDLLVAPDLIERVSTDLSTLGVVGEETNLLVAYLATISRKADRPFGVVIQSSSASGKSTLADAVCELVPPEDLRHFSALTGQALYYVGAGELAHTVLSVAEETGAVRASYALKLLVSEGKLTIASTGKDPATAKLRTRAYEVAGPVALVLTTTSTDIDPELANRLVVLGVDEGATQTRAVLAAQRRAATLAMSLKSQLRTIEATFAAAPEH